MRGQIQVLLICLIMQVTGLLSCNKNAAKIHIRVEAKTNQGEPVDKAQIFVDGKKIGETAKDGHYSTAVEMPAGSRRRLEIKKESEQYYYAPYIENFVVSEAARQEINIPAVLYFVPKVAASQALTENNPKSTPQEQALPKQPEKDAGAIADSTTNIQPLNLADENNQDEVIAPEVQSVRATDVQAKDQTQAQQVSAEQKDDIQSNKILETDIIEPKETADAKPVDEETKGAATDDIAVVALDGISKGEEKDQKNSSDVPLLNLDDEAASPAKEAPYPKLARQNAGHTVFTLLVYSSKKPVAEAKIFLGEESDGDLKLGCTTNARGRCVVRFPTKPEAPVTFVASKKGYKTAKQTVRVSNPGSLNFDLEVGQTIDIYAVTKTYNFTSGLRDVQVYVGGKRVGSTDRFGHYAYFYSGKSDDLVPIALKPKNHLPETFDTDFVASGPMTLVRYFSPTDPPSVRMVVMPLVAAGKSSPSLTTQITIADRQVKEAARQHLFASSAFKEYQTALFERNAARAGRSISQAVRQGWYDTDLKASVDAVLLPTLAFGGSKTSLELSIIDSRGRVLAAAAEPLDSLEDKENIARAVSQIAKRITRAFPFEGSILSKEADKVTINLGYSAGRGIRSGDVLDVYGVQSEKYGRSQTHGNIASLVVREVGDTTASCIVKTTAPRATIERGDLVVLRPRRVIDRGGVQVRVLSEASRGKMAQPVPQANVYLNDDWIGATDSSGRLYADITGVGRVVVIKHGFTTIHQSVDLKPNSKIDFTLKRESALVKVESKPSGVVVKIEGQVIGVTPIQAPVSIPSGFVKLELEAPKGYKKFASVLELDNGALEFTGSNAIILEKDEKSEAQSLLASNKVEEAIAKYESIPKSHSDWLAAQHELGEIYLTRIDQPAKAAEAFARVTSEPAVKQFTDKRFIGSHIDEAISLFLTGENLADKNREAALAHFRKAIDIFDAVIPHLRFVKPEQYGQAVHNVDFHRALARHRLWQYSQDPSVLVDTLRTWRSYLNGSARSIPADGVSKTYVENARVYLKQAMASQVKPAEVAR